MSWRYLFISILCLTNGADLMAQDFITRSKFIECVSGDAELVEATRASMALWNQFVQTFANPAARQNGFMVTVFRLKSPRLIPFGIAVSKWDGKKIYGRLVPNRLDLELGGEVSCELSQVVDWRYVDTFECEGGFLYRILYNRQRGRVQGKLDQHLLFFPDRPKIITAEMYGSDIPYQEREREIIDAHVLGLFRDIANLRYEEVERKLKSAPTLVHITAKMPSPYISFKKTNIAMSPTNPGQYGAMFGDSRMLNILKDHGALFTDPNLDPPLMAASCVGNNETVKLMCAWGFDPNMTNTDGRPCLHVALEQLADEELIETLLKHGADVNRTDCDNNNAIFFPRTVAMAALLLRNDPKLDLIDGSGENCVQSHLSLGQPEVAAYLVQQGAPREDLPEKFLAEFDLEGGKQRLLEYVREHESSEESERLQAYFDMNYGFVLPVEYLNLTK